MQTHGHFNISMKKRKDHFKLRPPEFTGLFLLLFFLNQNSALSETQNNLLLVHRAVNLSLCLGLPLWIWGRAVEHATFSTEERSDLAWAALHGCWLVATQHQQATQVYWEGEVSNVTPNWFSPYRLCDSTKTCGEVVSKTLLGDGEYFCPMFCNEKFKGGRHTEWQK